MCSLEKDIIWQGDSLDSVKAFPLRVRRAVGTELRRLQQRAGIDELEAHEKHRAWSTRDSRQY